MTLTAAPYSKGAPLRWDRDTESFLYRCQSCRLRGNGAWWPLDETCWNFQRGFSRCRACWAAHGRTRIRIVRQDAAYKEKERQYAADYYASLTAVDLAARSDKKRDYHREWMRAYRARRKAA